MKDHEFYKTGDDDAPDQIKDRNGEVCLCYCRVCKGIEGDLTTECPGQPMTDNERNRVYNDDLDFHHGEWVSRT